MVTDAYGRRCDAEPGPGSNTRCILYIVKRTQLYLDDDLWEDLHNRARFEKTTVSELVRTALREKYAGNLEKRAAAMEEFIGIRKNRTDIGDSTEYIRRLRKSKRLERLLKQWRS
jgi:Arc/MetJ family transcription regulator